MGRFKRFIVLGIVASLPLTLFPAIADAQTTHTVQMVGTSFSPQSLTIEEGDVVMWTNASPVIHTSTSGSACSPNGTWNSGNIFPGFSFSFTFNNAGTFPYFCIPHCFVLMIGTITVNDPPVGIEDTPVPVRYRLYQNAPNPFSPETTIEYEIEGSARVQIHVYNLKGQLVSVIENDVRAPGRYPAVWDGRDATGVRQATGVYFYQMSLDGVGVEMKKMVLLR